MSYTEARLDLDIDGQRVTLTAAAAPPARTLVKLMIRPEAIAICSADDATLRSEPRDDQLTGTVINSLYLGDKVEYYVRLTDQTLHVVRYNPPESERFMPGAAVLLGFPPGSVRLLPAG